MTLSTSLSDLRQNACTLHPEDLNAELGKLVEAARELERDLAQAYRFFAAEKQEAQERDDAIRAADNVFVMMADRFDGRAWG